MHQVLPGQPRAVWEEWSLAKKVHDHPATVSNPIVDVRWSKPPSGFSKINVDAAFPTTGDISCWGLCLRNDEGAFVGASSGWVPVKHSVGDFGALPCYPMGHLHELGQGRF